MRTWQDVEDTRSALMDTLERNIEVEKTRLRESGIDVRLGSCSCSIDELFVRFHDLPRA